MSKQPSLLDEVKDLLLEYQKSNNLKK
jgi:hypothetical protein